MKSKQPFTEKDFFINPEKQHECCWNGLDKWLKSKDAEKFFEQLEQIKY